MYAKWNGSICESINAWLRGFQTHLQHMGPEMYSWFILEMLDMHNGYVAAGDSSHLPQR